MTRLLPRLWKQDERQDQDIAEYAIVLAVILVLVVENRRLVGSNANNAFSNVAKWAPVRVRDRGLGITLAKSQ